MPEWSPAVCGPAPISAANGGGEIVSIHQEGDELAIAGGGRVYRTNQCYDQQATLARETHSRDPSGRSWRTRCSTPPSDPRRAMMNTLVVATSDTHIDLIETGRYEIVVDNGHCVADVRRSREFDLVARDLGAPAASASAVQAAPLPTVAAVPPPAPTQTRPSCDSPGDPARLEVRPSRKLLRTGASYALRAIVLDVNGCATSAPTSWSLVPGGGTTLTVDAAGHVSAPVDAAEGSAQVLVTAAGRSARVTIDVASPAHYDELLMRSGLNPQGRARPRRSPRRDRSADRTRGPRTRRRSGERCSWPSWRGWRWCWGGWRGCSRGGRSGPRCSRRGPKRSTRRRSARPTPCAPRSGRRTTWPSRPTRRACAGRARRPRVRAPTRAPPRHTEGRPGPEGVPHLPARIPHHQHVLSPGRHQAGDLGSGPEEGSAGAGSICPACKRGFTSGTRLCPHDGEELVPYALHAAVGRAMPGTGTVAMIGKGKICPTCGDRFDGAAAFCGKDGTALVLLN